MLTEKGNLKKKEKKKANYIQAIHSSSVPHSIYKFSW